MLYSERFREAVHGRNDGTWAYDHPALEMQMQMLKKNVVLECKKAAQVVGVCKK